MELSLWKVLTVAALCILFVGIQSSGARPRSPMTKHGYVPLKRDAHLLHRRLRRHRSLEEDEPRRPNISLDLDYLEYDEEDSSNELPTLHKEQYPYRPIVLEQEDPNFVEPIPSVTVAAGKTAELKCVIDNLGNYTVAWLNVDKQTLLAVHTHVIANQERVRVNHFAHREFSLLITDVRPEDSGYYMCQVNTRPMRNQVGFLNVVVAPYFLENTGYNVTTREHDNAVLRCHAGGNPQPKITWRREDSQVFNIERRHRATTHVGPELHLRGVSRKEMGIYICLASNGVPSSISRRIHLEVIFPPLIRVPQQLVQASLGDSVIVECHVEAYPKAEHLWLHRGQRLGSDSKYHTSNSQDDLKTFMRLRVRVNQGSDFGTYRCTAQNSIGHTEAKITIIERRSTPSPTTIPSTSTSRPIKSSRKHGTASSRRPPAHRPTSAQPGRKSTTPLLHWSVTTEAQSPFVNIYDINRQHSPYNRNLSNSFWRLQGKGSASQTMKPSGKYGNRLSSDGSSSASAVQVLHGRLQDPMLNLFLVILTQLAALGIVPIFCIR
ncbi:cell adhesion molecule 2-like [Varroa destructor]|uniref:Ig-like domain-containing protein n=1 Tax=Varroa destructor TaxID=109461 RepID=A0A7M7MHM6_VARDE|nr:cell adhesion molecule 2-like [Varroa destructor]